MRYKCIPLFSLLFFAAAFSHAAPCDSKVTVNVGSGPGTLQAIAATGCSPIEFDATNYQAVFDENDPNNNAENATAGSVVLTLPVTIKSGVTLDGTLEGGGQVRILGTIDPNVPSLISPLLRLSNFVTVKNVKLQSSTSVGALVSGNNNRLENVTFNQLTEGVVVENGVQNTITQCLFSQNTSAAITLQDDGNLNAAAPEFTGAQQLDSDEWEVVGAVPSNTAFVELYQHDNSIFDLPAQGRNYIGTADLVLGQTFLHTFSVADVNPALPITAIATDTSGNTSTFADVFIGQDEANFFAIVDIDGDGLLNDQDNCPNIANADAAGDNQNDGDGDGIGDACDNCPNNGVSDSQTDTDGDGDGDICDEDADGDGVINILDNCPLEPNPGQENADGDYPGDACDDDDTVANNANDTDDDSVNDDLDNCVFAHNPQQLDADQDGIGDDCDDDIDGDGVLNGEDNCDFIINPEQIDADNDGEGAPCDEDEVDADVNISAGGPDQDGDGIPDDEDNCPTLYNEDQANFDNDAHGDLCDIDDDNDGYFDSLEGETDIDGDGMPNSMDLDSDGDGILDIDDRADSNNDGKPDYLQPEVNGTLNANSATRISGTGCALIIR